MENKTEKATRIVKVIYIVAIVLLIIVALALCFYPKKTGGQSGSQTSSSIQ